MGRILCHLQNTSISFNANNLLNNIDLKIYQNDIIGISGKNGSGKSTLLKIISGNVLPDDGQVVNFGRVRCGYVEQIIKADSNLSGAQRFMERFFKVIHSNPDLLLLDEPTNHLDSHNRKILIRTLRGYKGAVVLVTHDLDLLRNVVKTLWLINDREVESTTTGYDLMMERKTQERREVTSAYHQLKLMKKENHLSRMKEQERVKKKKEYGEKKYGNDKIALRGAQSRGEATSNKNNYHIGAERRGIDEKLENLHLPEEIKFRFNVKASNNRFDTVLSITEGAVGYADRESIVFRINLDLKYGERALLMGKNGSGKSTFLKGAMGYPEIIKEGGWHTLQSERIGYLDQHYSNIDDSRTVIENLESVSESLETTTLRDHLNTFLFRKNDEVHKVCSFLSGGEKVRLSLALIAIKHPDLLILDEITNNVDIETRSHLVQVLKSYNGGIILVSHDLDFISEMKIDKKIELKGGVCREVF